MNTHPPIDDLICRARERGLRLTAQRRAVLAAITGLHQHFAAEQLLAECRTRRFTLCRATVYNTLHHLVDRGVLREVRLDPWRVLYDTDLSPHYHLLDARTGEVVDLPLNALSLDEGSLPDWLPKHALRDLVVHIGRR